MYEYKVIPAPVTPLKRKGLKKVEDRFAATLTEAMNDAAAEGWEYVRADTLPCEERSGLTSKTTRFQSLLVFRRPVAAPEPAAAPEEAAAPPEAPVADAPPAAPERPPLAAPVEAPERRDPVLDTMRVIRGPKRSEQTGEDAPDSSRS